MEPTIDNKLNYTVAKMSYIDSGENLSRNALHEALEIKCFYEGSATLLIGSEIVQVGAGDIVVINPYEFHATVEIGEEKGKYHLFMLPLNYFSDIPELDLSSFFLVEEKKFKTLLRGEERMHRILMTVAEETRQAGSFSDLMIKGLLMEFFALLLRNGSESALSSISGQGNLRRYSMIKPALRCIKNEYRRGLTLEELAQLCNVSKQHFCRTFKSVTGQSPMEYLRLFSLL